MSTSERVVWMFWGSIIGAIIGAIIFSWASPEKTCPIAERKPALHAPQELLQHAAAPQRKVIRTINAPPPLTKEQWGKWG